MSLKKILLVALATLVVCAGFALPCQAQNTFRRQRGLRWLGQGFGDGYHRKNPGYDTSYYNPYSAHNSLLISQSPEYQAIRPVPTNQELPRRFFNGVPFSAYAAPPQLNPAFQTMPGQQFQGSFSPSVGTGLADDDDTLLEGSFRPSDDEEEDEEVDDADDNDFRDDREDDAVEMDDDEDLEVEGLDDGDAETEVETSSLGGLSDLNDSLSFDFD